MRKLKLIITFLLVTIMSLTAFTGCGKKDKENGGASEGKYSRVWTMPATAKIKRDDPIPTEASDTLKISLAGGEAESGQIMITAKEVEITSYSVKVNDLKSGDNVLSASQIDVHIEKYIRTAYKTNRIHSTGWYPDALLPYEVAKKAGELKFNSEEKNDNQGIWITVNAPRDQKAGVYEGTIDLTVMDESFAVPVSVEVYPFNINENIHAKTAFAIWENESMMEKGYDVKPGSAEKKAVVKAEYEFLASKKIAPTNIPLSEIGRRTAPEFAQAVKKYASRPEISAYRIAVNAPNRVLNQKTLEEFLREIVKVSIEDNKVTYDYLSKAYCYFSEIDEPDPSTSNGSIFNMVKGINDNFLAAKQTIMDELNNVYKNVEGVEKLKSSLKELPHVVTSKRRPELEGRVQTYCPMVDVYDNREYFDETERRKVELGEGAWWYTCLKPVAPYPSYHVDDSLLGARAMGWMQKEYKIGGNLYWCTNVYRKYTGGKYVDRNIWTDPLAFPGANGDGYLTYPGKKYGVMAPFGTIRLDAIRDAQEDYEYLYMLEELVEKANKENGTNIIFDDLVNDLYSSIYTGVIAKEDYFAILNARHRVATMISALVNSKAIINVKPYSANSQLFNIEVSAPATATVKVNGKNASKNGNLFTGASKESNIEVEVNGKKYVNSMGSFFKALTSFEDLGKNSAGDYKLSIDSSVVMDGEKSLKAVLSNKSKTSEFTVEFKTKNLSSADTVVVYLYNGSSDVLKPTVYIGDVKGKTKRASGYLYPNKWTAVKIDISDPGTSIDLKKINKVKVSLKAPSGLAGDAIINLDNMYYFG